MADELKVGDALPDELLRRLPSPGRRRVLYFMRSLDCPVCVTHVKRLGELVTRLDAAQTNVVVFVPEPAPDGVQTAPGKLPPFPVVSGPDAFGQLGLRRVLLGAMQQSGMALVDVDGRILLVRRATLPYGAFDEKQLLDALGAAVARRGTAA